MQDMEAAAGHAAFPPLALFTDFDGTLVEIAETPDAIEVPAGLIEEIDAAMQGFSGAVAVLSGRPIADLDRYLSPRLAVAGAHGGERRRADGKLIRLPAARLEAAADLADRLQPLVEAHPGLRLERKEGTVALHYRQAPELWDLCSEAMREAAESVEDFGIIDGKMVVEARPAEVNKGEALRAFMQEKPFAGRYPVFIGDDTTDEDGFAMAQAMGGVGVKVGPGDSIARLRTPDIASVRLVIRNLASRAAQAGPV